MHEGYKMNEKKLKKKKNKTKKKTLKNATKYKVNMTC